MAEFIKNQKENLKGIKATYIIKDLFSFLPDAPKLNIILYNKYLQKLIGVDIQYYKKISGKYKIDGKNGKGKEYILYTNNLIFEGEYLNGKRNGKGKEYDMKGKLVFQGQYINGKRHGKGKEYDNFGDLIFDGEYLDGERNGNGKEYKFFGLE